MKNIILLILLLLIVSCSENGRSKVEFQIDPRIEYIAAICRLSGYKEYSNIKPESLVKLDKNLKSYPSNDLIKIFQLFRNKYSFGFSGPMELAGSLKYETMAIDFERIDLTKQFYNNFDLKELHQLSNELSKFYLQNNLGQVFKKYIEIHNTSLEERLEIVNKTGVFDWLARTYNLENNSTYYFVFSPSIGGMNFGGNCYYENGTVIRRGIFGQFFDEDLIVHEISHGYLNSIVDLSWPVLYGEIEQQYNRNREKLLKLAYGDSRSFAYELFVRAMGIIYLKRKDTTKAEEKERSEVGKGFTNISSFVNVIEKSIDVNEQLDLYKLEVNIRNLTN